MASAAQKLLLLAPSASVGGGTAEPSAFVAGDWSVAPGNTEADVTISSLPSSGGDPITDVEYRLDGGSWVSSGGTTDFTITGLINAQTYDVEIRAVNSIGAGLASDTKQVTPFAPAGDSILLFNAGGPTAIQLGML